MRRTPVEEHSCYVMMCTLLSPSQVLDKYHPPDYYLPESYTCFFLLKIPRYSCKPVLEEKLCYAINFCKSIDTDDYAHINLQEGMMMEEEEDDIP